MVESSRFEKGEHVMIFPNDNGSACAAIGVIHDYLPGREVFLVWPNGNPYYLLELKASEIGPSNHPNEKIISHANA